MRAYACCLCVSVCVCICVHVCTYTHAQRITVLREGDLMRIPVSVHVTEAVCCKGPWGITTCGNSSSHVDNKISIWHSSPVLSTCCTCGGAWTVTCLAGLERFSNLTYCLISTSHRHAHYKYLQVVLWDWKLRKSTVGILAWLVWGAVIVAVQFRHCTQWGVAKPGMLYTKIAWGVSVEKDGTHYHEDSSCVWVIVD